MASRLGENVAWKTEESTMRFLKLIALLPILVSSTAAQFQGELYGRASGTPGGPLTIDLVARPGLPHVIRVTGGTPGDVGPRRIVGACQEVVPSDGA